MALPTSQIDHVWLDRTRVDWTNMIGDAQHHEPLNWRIIWSPTSSTMSRSAAANLANAMCRQ